MTNLKAATFGSAMVDIITVLQSDSIEQISFSNALQQYLMVEPGRKIEAESITRNVGGGAINTAISFSKLGCKTAPIVKTGDDVAREYISIHCEMHNLNTDHLIRCDVEHTGSAVMVASHEKNAAIFTHRGANTTLSKEDLENISLEDFDLIHVAPLSGNSASMLPHIAQKAKEAGAFFSSNPGIRQITIKTNTVLSAAKHMTLISINEVEAAALAPCLSVLDDSLEWGSPKAGEAVIHSQGGEISVQSFCEELHKCGPQFVVITMGEKGAFLYDGKELHHQPIVEAEVAGTAGAGDSFVSTLSWGLKSNYSPEQALSLAAHNAASVVSYVNTTDGLLSKEELIEFAKLD